MPTTRWAKIIMAAGLALFALIAALNNLVDYGSNFQFVKHVMSMDTTFEGNALMHRAITREWAWHLAYAAIILAQALMFVLLALGSLRLYRQRRSAASAFNAAKGPAIAGATLGFVIWFVGMMVIGGEWFAMWQSETWNGQPAAARFTLVILAVLIFLNHADTD